MAKLIPGKNDLATKFPEIANEADGWDPSTVMPGSHKKLKWKCSKFGHRWSAIVFNRARKTNPRGCPVCAGRKVVVGYNDLATTHPEIANEAYGWKPSTVTAGCNKKKQWQGSKCRHIWSAVVGSRTHKTDPTGCPVCAGQQVLAGYNDLATTHPELAKEAVNYELTKTVTAGSTEKLEWKCSPYRHIWLVSPNNRTSQQSGCPVCAGKKVVVGYNDLATTHPELAKEAVNYELTKTVTAGSRKKLKWKCSKCRHSWSAIVFNRARKTNPRGCPVCADRGFSPEANAWLYLMERHGEQQFGITNDPQTRMWFHKTNGWKSLDWHGPALGTIVFQVEHQLKQWLKKTHGTITGTTENWSTDKYSADTLHDLCRDAGVDLTEIPRDESLMQKGLFRRKND